MSEHSAETDVIEQVIAVLDELRRGEVRISVKPSRRTLRENTINEVLCEAIGLIRDLGNSPERPDR